MTRIEGAGAARDPQQFQAQQKKTLQLEQQAQAKKQSADSIKLSDAAMKLAKKTGKNIRSREALIEAVQKSYVYEAQETPDDPRFGSQEYLEKIGILANTNLLIERSPVAENAAYVKAWRDQGKKLIVRAAGPESMSRWLAVTIAVPTLPWLRIPRGRPPHPRRRARRADPQSSTSDTLTTMISRPSSRTA